MGTLDLLSSLFRYQAWAHGEFLDALAGFDPATHTDERHLALRLLNHCHVVNRIFAAHLTGAKHGFAADNTEETPSLPELRLALAQSDRWYLDYLGTATRAQLAQAVPFSFTDGDLGCMTRQEMLVHVATHNTYHRGEVGRILTQLSARAVPGLRLPWDTYAVHLHRTEPARRREAS
jgi:uncharacterized damage-inducible protein DinB